MEVEGTASLPENTVLADSVDEELVTVPLYVVHDDIRHEIGTATINTKTLATKAKVESPGNQLFEVTATKFSFGRIKEDRND